MKIKNALVYSYQITRSLHFTVQQFTLPLIESLASGKNEFRRHEDFQFTKNLFMDLLKFLKEDSDRIAKGIYPIEVLKPESPKDHWVRYPKILFDDYFRWRRKQKYKAREFTKEAQEFLQEMPDYFRRNFHFQTDGYLSKESAELYEHQVEILFSGTADAMRRLIINLLKKYKLEGEGFSFLEVGAGTGRLTRFMSLSFPKAKITATDLSHAYLKKAQENLKEFPRIDFMQTAGESLPFKNESFDVAYSCFLFHELPLVVRRQVLRESHRVLKAGGVLGFVDSLQKHDKEVRTNLLELFPEEFHEPFFKNYSLNPMEDLLVEEGFEILDSQSGFFSKAVLARKKA